MHGVQREREREKLATGPCTQDADPEQCVHPSQAPAEFAAQNSRRSPIIASDVDARIDVMCRCSQLPEDPDRGTTGATGVPCLQDVVQVLRDGRSPDHGLQLLGRKKSCLLSEGASGGGGVQAATRLEGDDRKSQLLPVLRSDSPDLQGLLVSRRPGSRLPELQGVARCSDHGDAEGPALERGELRPGQDAGGCAEVPTTTTAERVDRESRRKTTDASPRALLKWRMIIKGLLQRMEAESWRDVEPMRSCNETYKRSRENA